MLVGNVDCTDDENKDLCKEYGIKGYPTLKHIFAGVAEDYNGGRDLQDLTDFAKKLKPLCTPAHIERCDANQTKYIDEVKAQDATKREAQLKSIKDEIATRDADLDTLLTTLCEKYETAVVALEEYKKSMRFRISVLEAFNKETIGMETKEEL